MTRITWLITRYLRDELSTAEKQELEDWIAADPNRKKWMQRFEEPGIHGLLYNMSEINWKDGHEKFLQRNPQYRETERRPTVFFHKWMAAAAILLLILGAGAWWILHRQSIPSDPVQRSQQPYAQDVQPGSEKATLTTGNEQPVLLDTLKSANGKYTNENGQLNYSHDQNIDAAVSMNTVTTPKGGTYRVVLPDGTKVWLNAASSIRFPSAFTGNERKVTVDGELYFDVAKDAQKQFIVQSNHSTTTVLGTQFNIADYSNDPYTSTTLVQGKVVVSKGDNKVMLQPGSQSVISNTNDAAPISIRDANLEETVAWKNGYFIFNDAQLPEIMRMVERWYNVSVIYEATISKQFVGVIRRNEPLSKLLQLLELTGEVKFSINGNTVKVSR
ncbi:FecR family protein [Pseudoflavitalea sp. G-6-1-2]|uniref:FecR family protein n=1 Tax=Pseudoflavitalea sp. G-6-1-2 TaxID=2728841 RepID=UPI00146EA6FB|nr:FecR family protein [Pseudoflavitalea sp. G-6-1-2]NML23464.1 FecR family protein [Pseudoflavitalea sp. G-6-1-2]